MIGAIEAEIIIKILLAAVLGMIVGVEREMHYRPAGLRTHTLVAMGAALFAMLSVSFAGANVDPSRIAAGVVTGIGFLGAGVIFHNKDKTIGLTTAADLWVIAAIGLAVGLGLYVAAVITTIIVLVILTLGSKVERNTLKSKKKTR
ncbi:MgtC/SapB family protein [Candidatus Aenigmatarchaeota archaeon]